MKRLILLTIFAIIGLQGNLNSQIQKNPKRFFIEDQDRKYVQYPFKLINNLIILTVSVNKSDTLNFILDSGISNTIITDPFIANLLQLKYIREIKLCGFGGENSLTAQHSIENEIRIEGILGEHQDILVINNPDYDFSKYLGIKIHGLLGYNLFRDLIIEINYENRLISFYKPKTYVYKQKRRSVTLPLNISDTKPYIDLTVTLEDSTQTEGKFLIDTGASFAMWMDIYSNSKFKLPHKTQSLFLGSGLGGPIYGIAGRIKELKVGNLKMTNILTSFPDTSIHHEVITSFERNGTIGSEILSRFNLIFDYRNNKLTLKPNSRFHDSFPVNLTGMEICCPVPGETSYNISNIMEKSPADNAGLKMGDKIVAINFQELNNMPYPEIQSLLTKTTIKKLVVEYERDYKRNFAILVLSKTL